MGESYRITFIVKKENYELSMKPCILSIEAISYDYKTISTEPCLCNQTYDIQSHDVITRLHVTEREREREREKERGIKRERERE